MFITGQIKKLQLFWVDKNQKDKIFVQLTFEQAQSGHLFIVKGYQWLREVQAHTEALKHQSNIKLNMNPLTVRALHSADIPIFKAMQKDLKNELTKWDRLGRKYNKDAMKIFINIKSQLEKKAPNQNDLDKFEKFLTILESRLNNTLCKLDSMLVAFEEKLQADETPDDESSETIDDTDSDQSTDESDI